MMSPPTRILEAGRQRITFPRRPLIMGVLNINDDSFSGDGILDPELAAARAAELISQGADILDAGAESARTNRAPISIEEEIARLEPLLARWEGICRRARPRDDLQIYPPLLSINTWRAEVVGFAVHHGADLINDMSGLPDPENARLCAASEAALLIMHTIGLPKQNHSHVRHQDVVEAVRLFFREKLELARAAGMPPERLLLDPGLGFAKQDADDLTLCARAAQLAAEFQRPILWPISRKGFLGRVVGEKDPARRDAATIGALAFLWSQGAHILRIHNVDAAYLALRTLEVLR